jgi:hypothetical protein
MIELSECTRDNFCFECANEKCLHHRKIEADCPKYSCDLPEPMTNNCEQCPWIKNFIIEKLRRRV